jgi:hypothetical protein
MTRELRVVSTSRASDGSFTAISEIGALLVDSPYRLIGGVAVVLHQLRLGLEHPIRATADADFGVPPYALHDDSLIEAVASLGYRKVAGNRWSRSIDQTREATVDLLVPSYRTRLRSSVQHGGTNTTEVGGLAVALTRPAVRVIGSVVLTDGTELPLELSIPDVTSMLGLKLHARSARAEDRDAIDLWTCLELIVAADEFDDFRSADFDDVRDQLRVELSEEGPSMRTLIAGVSDEEAHRRRTRIRGLVRAVGGSVPPA